MQQRGWRGRLPGVLLAGAVLSGCGNSSTADGGGTIEVQVSGESLATSGFKFPNGSELAIRDGWELQLSHVLVSVGRVWLSENPNRAPSDQSQSGDVVAELSGGPWLVDLHQEGSEPGAGGEGTAIPLGMFDMQNENGGAPFADGEYYAFSFETVPPAAGMELVNLADDAEAKALSDEMAANGYTVLYAGTATFKGTQCDTSDDSYDFAKIPPKLDFKLGFATPTSYLNCQNQDNQGDPIDGEEYPRGVVVRTNQAARAQMTFHLDHPFYSAAQHEPALYFDQLAARLVGKPEGTVLTLEEAAGADPSAFTDGAGTSLPWRACDGSAVAGAKQRSFDTGSVPLDPSGEPGKALRNYRDFVHYVQSAQGHMNGGEGLCFAKRNYPSPP